MAAKPSTVADSILEKVRDQVTCGICLEPYKQPKQLKCCHVFCEQCLQSLVDEGHTGHSLSCPNCRQDTPIQVGGVPGLQSAFYLDTLLEIQDVLKKIPLSDHCPKHPGKVAELYCDQCDQLICDHCLVAGHRDHQYDLLSHSFAKQEKVIVESLKPIKQQIAALETTVKSVDTRCAGVVEVKTAVVAEIHATMVGLHQALELREAELVGQVEHTAQQKLETLTAQRGRFDQQLSQLRNCHDFVEESRRSCSQGKILGMKSALLKQINDLAASFKPETLALTEQADMMFTHNQPQLVKACEEFGKVYCRHPVCPEKSRASGEGTKVAMRGQTVTVSVEALDKEGKAYLRPVDNLKCKLFASDGNSQVRGTVKRRNDKVYDISYQPQVTGKHQLHILIEDRPILHSPFTVNIIPNVTAPAKIRDIKGPWGIAVTGEGETVISKYKSDSVSIVTNSGKKNKSFGTHGSFLGQFNGPAGVAVDARGHILVADSGNHRIQQFSSSGSPIRTVGTRGNGPLQFHFPVGIAVHPLNHKVYVAESDNHRIQVLNSGLTHSSYFGRFGSSNGKLNCPNDISMDRDGNVYVTDTDNHRIQVFTAEGVYLRQFGKKGKKEDALNLPVGIAIDSDNVVYIGEWGNKRVSLFSADGEFIKSFGRQGSGPAQFDSPYGLAVDKKGTLYVCDTDNNRIQIFT